MKADSLSLGTELISRPVGFKLLGFISLIVLIPLSLSTWFSSVLVVVTVAPGLSGTAPLFRSTPVSSTKLDELVFPFQALGFSF